MFSSIMYALLSVLAIVASSVMLWLGYELAVCEWTHGPELIAVVWSWFMAGLAVWGSYVAASHSVHEFQVRNY